MCADINGFRVKTKLRVLLRPAVAHEARVCVLCYQIARGTRREANEKRVLERARACMYCSVCVATTNALWHDRQVPNNQFTRAPVLRIRRTVRGAHVCGVLCVCF